MIELLVDNSQAKAYEYPAAVIAELRSGFKQARTGLLSANPAEFNAGTKAFTAALVQLGKSSHLYPTASEIALEVHYNHAQPFVWTIVVAAIASVVLIVSLAIDSRLIYRCGFALLLAAIAVMAYGMLLRVAISGRGPVTNMYETIIWAAFVAAVIGVILELMSRQRVLAATSAVVVVLSTLLAHIMPISMGASIEPLQPVLRSNYWLVVHVLTIVASYGAFMLAWALGNIAMVLYLLDKDRPEKIDPLAQFTYRAMQAGVLLLAIGTVLGGWWAAESWGRFWGWDPKEVWALIALLGYLAILHARFIGWVGQFGLLAGAVISFALVMMAWYGVNFILGAGLHAYAFGSGGTAYVIGAVIANVLFVVVTSAVREIRLARRQSTSPSK